MDNSLGFNIQGGIEMKSIDIPIVITPTLTLSPPEGEGNSRVSGCARVSLRVCPNNPRVIIKKIQRREES
jgi:hypothetical protein